MIGVLVVTHGEFGNALLDTLKMILGEAPGIRSVALTAKDSPENLQLKMERALAEMDPRGEGVLILVDMLGGTPFNVGVRLAAERKVSVLTGVNLPMLVKAATEPGGGDLDTLSREIQQAARDGVVTSVELFKKP